MCQLLQNGSSNHHSTDRPGKEQDASQRRTGRQTGSRDLSARRTQYLQERRFPGILQRSVGELAQTGNVRHY